ncbi:MAG TPA: hypothetical protein GXX75_09095 [Clostridiales bacterium]|nr:hypothetical protein [Clostridiales bacterium]
MAITIKYNPTNVTAVALIPSLVFGQNTNFYAQYMIGETPGIIGLVPAAMWDVNGISVTFSIGDSIVGVDVIY